MITIALTYFQSLTRANLAAALYSVRQQDLSDVDSLILVDNDTADLPQDLRAAIDVLDFPIPTRVLSYKHGDPTRTHAWSTNRAIDAVTTPYVFVTRADYLLAFDALDRMHGEIRHADPDSFVTGNGCHLAETIEACEATTWRTAGPDVLPGTIFDYTEIDAGVFLMRRDAWARVGGLDERLTAWGHAQTKFQHQLYLSGTVFRRIPLTLFWHPWHHGARDLSLAHAQLRQTGADLHGMWQRYEGRRPY